MERRNRAAVLVLALAAVLAILLPARALLAENGFLAIYVRMPASGRMMAEIAALLVLASAALFLPRSGAWRLTLYAALGLAFVWVHQVSLPMAVSALYLGSLLLIGRFLSGVFGEKERGGLFSWFLLGAAFAIAFFCLLSAFGQGQIRWLRLTVYGLGILLFLRERSAFCRWAAERARGLGAAFGSCPAGRRAALAWMLVMVLIQAGRMNLALDFDTLWYGVRSEYILAFGGGIYENPGLTGMVYVYSKGWEVLTLPLCDLASHSYLMFFNLWLALLGVWQTAVLARRLAENFAAIRRPGRSGGACGNRGGDPESIGSRAAWWAAALTVTVPGIMNMAITAKSDVITWLLQLMMLGFFLDYLREERFVRLAETAGAYLLSLTMKPTSLVFSTAVFGMMGLYLLAARRLKLRAPLRRWGLLLFPAGALCGIWARTMRITGMPVTSVFTSVFELFGFEMKYPFAVSELPQNYSEEGNAAVLARRLWQMLLQPEGDDMSHVILAWGTSLLFYLLTALIVLQLLRRRGKKGAPEAVSGNETEFREEIVEERTAIRINRAAAVIFWPFLAVNLVSLVMLYQVDGNYFMLLYSMILLAVCRALPEFLRTGFYRGTVCFLLPVMCFNLFVTAHTNWAWALGFSEIRLFNKGRENHRAKEQERLWSEGNAQIWLTLAADPETRVIAFGDHPFCLQFPCIVESYRDVTSPWGNVELVNSAQAFEEYLDYAGTDYIYAEGGYLGPGNWEWSYGLLRELIGRGTLSDLFFEEGNVLLAVAKEPVLADEAEENLAQFDAHYRVWQPDAQSGGAAG